MDVAVAGSSGLIGQALVDRLRGERHRVRRLVRREAAGEDEIGWDPAGGALAPESLASVDAVVNLAGAGIGDRRWTEHRKQVVLESRTRTTALLAETLAMLDRGPRTLLNASAIGYYGDRGDEELTEQSGPGEDFLSGVVRAWEAATGTAREAGVRVVCLRSGIVLAAQGGALQRQLPLFRFGLGGRLGSGDQWWSWISIDDEVAAITWLLDHDEVSGPVNVTAPAPVTNQGYTRTLGAVLGRPTLLPTPGFGPKLLLGSQLVEEMLYTSQRVVPAALTSAGFGFQHPELEQALRHLLDRPARL